MHQNNIFEKKKQFLINQEFYFLLSVSLWSKLSHQQLSRYKSILIWWQIDCNESIDWNTEIIDEFKDLLFNEDHFLPEININESLPWSIEFLNRYKDLWSWELLAENPAVIAIPGVKQHFFEQLSTFDEYYSDVSSFRNPEDFLISELGLQSLDFIAERNFTSVEDIEKTENLDWKHLSANRLIPWSLELIITYKDKWSWDVLSSNNNLPWSNELIEKYENKWNWTNLSQNEGVPWTLELIKKYENKIDWCIKDKNHCSDISIGTGISSNYNINWDRELLSNYLNKLNNKDVSISQSAKWDIDLLSEFSDFWDYNILSRNKLVWDIVFPEFNNKVIINSLLDTILERRIN